MDQNLDVKFGKSDLNYFIEAASYPEVWQELPEDRCIRVVLAEDNQRLRALIRLLLESASDIEVVGEASNGFEALSAVALHDPDMLLLDMEMPFFDGRQVTEKLRQSGSSVCILIVSSYNDPQLIQGVLESGATGYLIKDDVPEILVKAVRGFFYASER